jgi:hypothetical protein
MMRPVLCIFLLLMLVLSASAPAPAVEPSSKAADCFTLEQFLPLYLQYRAEHGLSTSPPDDEGMREEYERSTAFTDITPPSVREETGCAVFKNRNFEAFFACNGRIRPAGISFGGFGAVDMAACDFDGDGRKEILFAYSWGSGLHRSHLAVFNPATMEETQLDYVNLNRDMALQKVSDTEFLVYDASLRFPDGPYMAAELEKGALLARVIAKNGTPFVAPVD